MIEGLVKKIKGVDYLRRVFCRRKIIEPRATIFSRVLVSVCVLIVNDALVNWLRFMEESFSLARSTFEYFERVN